MLILLPARGDDDDNNDDKKGGEKKRKREAEGDDKGTNSQLIQGNDTNQGIPAGVSRGGGDGGTAV